MTTPRYVVMPSGFLSSNGALTKAFTGMVKTVVQCEYLSEVHDPVISKWAEIFAAKYASFDFSTHALHNMTERFDYKSFHTLPHLANLQQEITQWPYQLPSSSANDEQEADDSDQAQAVTNATTDEQIRREFISARYSNICPEAQILLLLSESPAVKPLVDKAIPFGTEQEAWQAELATFRTQMPAYMKAWIENHLGFTAEDAEKIWNDYLQEFQNGDKDDLGNTWATLLECLPNRRNIPVYSALAERINTESASALLAELREEVARLAQHTQKDMVASGQHILNQKFSAEYDRTVNPFFGGITPKIFDNTDPTGKETLRLELAKFLAHAPAQIEIDNITLDFPALHIPTEVMKQLKFPNDEVQKYSVPIGLEIAEHFLGHVQARAHIPEEKQHAWRLNAPPRIFSSYAWQHVTDTFFEYLARVLEGEKLDAPEPAAKIADDTADDAKEATLHRQLNIWHLLTAMEQEARHAAIPTRTTNGGERKFSPASTPLRYAFQHHLQNCTDPALPEAVAESFLNVLQAWKTLQTTAGGVVAVNLPTKAELFTNIARQHNLDPETTWNQLWENGVATALQPLPLPLPPVPTILTKADFIKGMENPFPSTIGPDYSKKRWERVAYIPIGIPENFHTPEIKFRVHQNHPVPELDGVKICAYGVAIYHHPTTGAITSVERYSPEARALLETDTPESQHWRKRCRDYVTELYKTCRNVINIPKDRPLISSPLELVNASPGNFVQLMHELRQWLEAQAIEHESASAQIKDHIMWESFSDKDTPQENVDGDRNAHANGHHHLRQFLVAQSVADYWAATTSKSQDTKKMQDAWNNFKIACKRWRFTKEQHEDYARKLWDCISRGFMAETTAHNPLLRLEVEKDIIRALKLHRDNIPELQRKIPTCNFRPLATAYMEALQQWNNRQIDHYLDFPPLQQELIRLYEKIYDTHGLDHSIRLMGQQASQANLTPPIDENPEMPQEQEDRICTIYDNHGLEYSIHLMGQKALQANLTPPIDEDPEMPQEEKDRIYAKGLLLFDSFPDYHHQKPAPNLLAALFSGLTARLPEPPYLALKQERNTEPTTERRR